MNENPARKEPFNQTHPADVAQHSSDFTRRALIAVGITLVCILLILLIYQAFNVFLLILAGVLIAVFFRGTAGVLSTRFHLSKGWSLAIVITAFFLITGLAIYLLAPQVSAQASNLSDELPRAVEKFKEHIAQTKWGEKLIEQIPTSESIMQNKDSWVKRGLGVFSATFGVLADLYVILFIGIFFTAQPSLYTKGIVMLFPLNKRERAGEVISKTGSTLYKWILGKSFSMLVVGVLTTIGLSILGIPMALALGVFAGLLSFIPNFGPIISLIPAALIALLEGPNQALYVIILYVGIQAVESNLLTPLVQKRMVEIPPALVIISQVLLGVFTGTFGLILATPIMVIIMVLVKMIYIQDILGDEHVEVK